MRALTADEKKVYDRLRKAYRRAGLAVVTRKGSLEEMKRACQRITERAIKLGWLTLPMVTKP